MDALTALPVFPIPTGPASGHVHLWEYEVGQGYRAQFEQYYGSQGPWVRLFRKSAGYRGTLLMRDLGQSRRYITLDVWESIAAYRAFRREHEAQYAALDRLCGGVTTCETRLGELALL